MDSPESTFFTSREVADLVAASPTTVLGWIDRGLLRCHRTPGGHRRIAREDLVAFLREHGMPVPAGLVEAPRILIVDDDEAFTRSIARGLARLAPGATIEVAHDGIDGLVRIGALHPTLVILDVVMPGMDGLAVCRRLHASRETRDIVVVVVTGRHDVELHQRLLDAGAAGVLEKPIRLEELRPFLGPIPAGRALAGAAGREP